MPTDTATVKPTMVERIDAEIDANPLGHQWVGHSSISLDFKTAKRAAFRNSFRAQEEQRIDVLEVVCHVCRQPFDAIADGPVHSCEAEGCAEGCEKNGKILCPGQIDNTYLIGGDQRERKKRNVPEQQGTIYYNVIDRRGMNGYSVHAGR